jgi:hypothetical protein
MVADSSSRLSRCGFLRPATVFSCFKAIAGAGLQLDTLADLLGLDWWWCLSGLWLLVRRRWKVRRRGGRNKAGNKSSRE